MSELSNCAQCGVVFAKTVRDICHACYRKEEEDFKTVYRFLTKRQNREATIQEIVAATDVEEDLIIKFMKENRLRASRFPKLAYPCEKCGTEIVQGRLCHTCSSTIKTDLDIHNKMENSLREMKERDHQSIYYTLKKESDE